MEKREEAKEGERSEESDLRVVGAGRGEVPRKHLSFFTCHHNFDILLCTYPCRCLFEHKSTELFHKLSSI